MKQGPGEDRAGTLALSDKIGRGRSAAPGEKLEPKRAQPLCVGRCGALDSRAVVWTLLRHRHSGSNCGRRQQPLAVDTVR